MTKIVTAIYEENILRKMIKNKIIENKNILYREAILDTIKNNKKIETIIISEKLPGEINFTKLIKQIKKNNKKIKIIIILNNKKIKSKLIKNNVKNIYYNNIFSIYKLIKELKENNNIKNKKNSKLENKIKNNKLNIIINKIKNRIIYNKKEEISTNKNICIFGENKIDKKIIELIIIKNLILENKKVITINLKINNKKRNKKFKNNINNKKTIKLNKIKNKYYLKTKFKFLLKEKIINKNFKKIININKILENRNDLIKIAILKKIIKK